MHNSAGQPLLVVEDNDHMREAIRDMLRCEGFASVEARDGIAALAYLRNNPPPSAILLDWNMAPMSGEEFIQEVAKDAAFSRIPLVLLTADSRVIQTPRPAQVVSCLSKPIDLDALFAIINRYCVS